MAFAAQLDSAASAGVGIGYQGPTPEHQAEIERVASVIAMRPTRVRCPSSEEAQWDGTLQGAWGYAFLLADEITLAPLICRRLEQMIDGDWSSPPATYGLALLVLIHEAYHIRDWDLRRNEAAVECRAIRHIAAAAGLLGVSGERLPTLRMGAQLYHWRLVRRNEEYYSARCKVPRP